MLDSLLVANRGEIAVRILRAARALGIRAIAVYSDPDREAPHVREADGAVRIGPAAAARSYLSIPALLEAAERFGAEAVHPGYGFLSESADFAGACERAGLTFVGPSAKVIARMGRKDEARRLALEADVPVVPALEDEGDAALLARAEAELGLPLMVKAVAGGGGRGMRVVRRAGDLEAALGAARRESRAAFGDDRLLVERYVERPRHVEVQVLGDAHGDLVHLYERDCSVQRRHQKIVEEAPAPTISAELRDRLCAAAVRLAEKVGYTSAGTVEFMVEGEEIFFLEMNTRLQVEHPVTEAITGRDLVELQLRVAAGERLPFTQDELAASGHAIEARVYAEDPASGFLPQAGTATTVRWSDRARVDAALEAGQAVGTAYDPLLAKLTVHGSTREAARRALVAALEDSAVFGVTTNMGFLRELVDSPPFAQAVIDSDWLDRGEGDFGRGSPALALVAGAWALARAAAHRRGGPFTVADGWRLGAKPATFEVELLAAGERRRVRVDRAAGTVDDGERAWTLREATAEPDRLALEIDGTIHRFQLELSGAAVSVGHRGATHSFRRPEPFEAAAEAAPSDGSVLAPMPGTVLSVSSSEGEKVESGQTVVVLEAMKMELSLAAPISGSIERLAVEEGDQVGLGDLMFSVDGH